MSRLPKMIGKHSERKKDGHLFSLAFLLNHCLFDVVFQVAAFTMLYLLFECVRGA